MKRSLLFGCVALGLLAGPAIGQVIPPLSPVAGISQTTLADEWWPWILTAKGTTNPLFDTTGAWAGLITPDRFSF